MDYQVLEWLRLFFLQATEINVIDTNSAKSVESQKSIEMLRNKAKEYASANAMGVKSWRL